MSEDAYLARLTKRLRIVASEVWHSEQARGGAEFALVWARESYLGNTPRPYPEALADGLGPGFARPPHAGGCVSHRHGRHGCLERGCGCVLAISRQFPPLTGGESS